MHTDPDPVLEADEEALVAPPNGSVSSEPHAATMSARSGKEAKLRIPPG
jgi:hypothetical protein